VQTSTPPQAPHKIWLSRQHAPYRPKTNRSPGTAAARIQPKDGMDIICARLKVAEALAKEPVGHLMLAVA
jgi:hypothetical protein